MELIPVGPENRERINAFITERWYTLEMIVRGEVVDMAKAEGFAAVEEGGIVGLITYVIDDRTCEITSLDSLREGRGIGTALIARVKSAAREKGCHRLVAVTTNDNINALRFYQKRGFDMARLYHDALEVSRRLKPEIPLIGMDGIPLRHEIEFEMDLTCAD